MFVLECPHVNGCLQGRCFIFRVFILRGGGGQGATIIQMKLQIANKHSGIQIQTSICGYDTGPLQENV